MKIIAWIIAILIAISLVPFIIILIVIIILPKKIKQGITGHLQEMADKIKSLAKKQ